jgi:PAS domain S-box-containing protein
MRSATETQRSAASRSANFPLLAALPDGAFVLDAAGVILATNDPAVVRYIGRGYADVAQPLLGLTGADREAALDGVSRVTQGQTDRYSLEFRSRSGSEERWCRVRVTPVDVGGDAAALVIHEDVTTWVDSRLRLQHAIDMLRESESRFRQMAENIGEIVWILQVNPRKLLYISPTYEQVFGRSAEELYADPRSFTRAVIAEDLPKVVDSLETRAHDAVDTVYRIRDGQGELRWMRSRAFPIRDASGAVYRVTGIIEDITDLQRAQEELSRLQQEVLAVTERERRRIGQDLHDGLGQHLTGIAFLSKSLQRRIKEKAQKGGKVSEREASEAGTIAELVQNAIGQTRSLARGLHPVEATPTGLSSALQELAMRTEAVFALKCSFECLKPVMIEDDEVANNLYRIAQEAVSNASKYASAGEIEITLSEDGGEISLCIIDDGVGLPSEAERGSGMGLRIMRYRAELIGGKLAIRNGGPRGTVVQCVLPSPVRDAEDS